MNIFDAKVRWYCLVWYKVIFDSWIKRKPLHALIYQLRSSLRLSFNIWYFFCFVNFSKNPDTMQICVAMIVALRDYGYNILKIKKQRCVIHITI